MPPAPAQRIVDDLFRHEAGRLTSVLVRILGGAQIDLAEEIVQDTLVTALERWRYGDVPENPAAWLTQVAKNRAIDTVRKRATARRLEPAVAQAQELGRMQAKLSAHFANELPDDMVRMMFSCCTPRLKPAAQVAIMLKTLCGFSVDEIAGALLSKPAAIEKRLSRGKAVLREHGVFEVTERREIAARLVAVRRTVYALFNEGYHGAHPEQPIRNELCGEAMRLCGVLLAHPDTDEPATHALLSLMAFHASRLPGRRDAVGALVPMREQERARWNPDLQRLGFAHLSAASTGDTISPFHLEAAIAATHAQAPSWQATDWTRIASLYETLTALNDTPIVRLNHAVAIGQRDGAAAWLAALDALPERTAKALATYPFFHAARAEAFAELGHEEDAVAEFRRAARCARNGVERAFYEGRAAATSAAS